jgi:hypothetical protein
MGRIIDKRWATYQGHPVCRGLTSRGGSSGRRREGG